MSSGTNKERLNQNNAKLEELIELVKTKGSGPNGEYNIDAIIEEDGTQTLNITDWDYVPRASFDPVFANNTPAQISAVSEEIARNGYTSAQVAEIYSWNLGDTIPITLTSGEVIEMQIIGINHDILSSDHTSKAGLTLQMKDCLATFYAMNNEETNLGGFPSSIMRTETLPTIRALLPKEWQDIIKLVDKKSANGGKDNYSAILTTSDTLFLLAEVELVGSETIAQDGINEGSQYEYWINKVSSDRIKKYDADTDGVSETECSWFLRSSGATGNAYFSIVNNYGYAGALKATSLRGISFACCI